MLPISREDFSFSVFESNFTLEFQLFQSSSDFIFLNIYLFIYYCFFFILHLHEIVHKFSTRIIDVFTHSTSIVIISKIGILRA